MSLTYTFPHRNSEYMYWLLFKPCVITGDYAEVVHHIRLNTGGGMALKPSDYFCIPLKSYYHTTGPQAVHRMGEKSFFEKFDLNPWNLIQENLKDYLEYLNRPFEVSLGSIEVQILSMIETIESLRDLDQF